MTAKIGLHATLMPALVRNSSSALSTRGQRVRLHPGSKLLKLLVAALLVPLTSIAGVTTAQATANDRGYSWGGNSVGQLGNGTTTDSLTAASFGSSISFVSVSAGSDHACGLDTSGQAWCWGDGGSGELGNGGNTDSSVPVQVSQGGLVFASVSAGGGHSCAADNSGAGYCWGANVRGQLGNSSTSPSNVPVAVTGGYTFSTIEAGSNHTCGVDGDEAYCWGLNDNGQLGDNSQTNRSVPTKVADPDTGREFWDAIALGSSHTCAIALTGDGFCWGSNAFAQLGNGDPAVAGTRKLIPTALDTAQKFSSISSAGYGSCAVSTGAGGYCWGFNNTGQVGDGSEGGGNSRPSPTAVSGGLAFSFISSGLFHTCGISTSNEAYCWGANTYGQLGTGDTNKSLVPKLIDTSGAGTPSTFGAISAGPFAGGFTIARGPATTAPAATATPDPLAFGSQAVGSTSSASNVTVTNTGTADLVFGTGAATLSGTNAADFAITTDGCSGQTVIPTATCTISLTFTPSAAGARSADLEVASNDPATPTTVALTGTGTTAAGASASPTTVDFGDVEIDSTSTTLTVTITSTGNTDLVFGSGAAAITGGSASGFTIETDNCSGQTIVVGNSCIIALSFTPASTGSVSATLSVSSNDPASPTTVTLTGSSGTPPVIPETFTFWFDTSTGGTCLDSVQVTDTHIYKLPDTTVACVPEGSAMVGWSIPGQERHFAPGDEVVVSADQTFTAVAMHPYMEITLDSNVGMETPCLRDGVDVTSAEERSYRIWPTRSPDSVLASLPECSPQGFTFIGWTNLDTPLGSGTAQEGSIDIAPFGRLPGLWLQPNPNPINEMHLYALWKRDHSHGMPPISTVARLGSQAD